MRLPISTLLFSGIVAASTILRRQNNGHGTESGLDRGACKKITLIFGRGSTESGNMGSYVGPYLANALTKEYGNDISVQGVNYDAGWMTNYIGGDPKGWAEFERLFKLADSKCPNTIIIASGYSQGAGLLHNTFPKLDARVKSKIAGIVVFGDTYQVKDKGMIPSYPKEKFLAFCSATDLVCHDATAKDPIILPAHMLYSTDVPEATRFFKKMITAAQSSSGNSGAGAPKGSAGEKPKGKGLGGFAKGTVMGR